MTSPNALQAVIFDLDGVLAETEDLHRQAYNNIFEQLGIVVHWTPDDYRRVLPQVAGTKWEQLPMPDRWQDRQVFAREAYTAKRREYLRLLCQAQLPTRPGVRALLVELAAANIAIGAASTSAREAAEAVIEHLREGSLRPWFQVICAGDDVRHKKPAPDIYLLAADQLGIPPAHCVAIEDTRHGMQAALAAGMKCVVTPSEYTRDDRFPEADLVVPELTDGPVNLSRLRSLWIHP